ncbi:Ubiquitin carboxyl-terminal hydrolase CYLD [Orchesella cincta]|uniref:Ubiquitin carboxyl-terminal hydrolase CYLD n=1 Tax=Orchesella cincta TaxID=48709 RepID=A0A1D2N1L0_ORCCI|nr:Ubiquitin carboxyl-terminal hydrolase CYLD [Orchesella cincta]
MLSEIFSFFTGTNGTPKSVSYTDHIIPRPPVREAQTLSYAECANWIGKRVDNSIGGMSGKVNGQKLFECKTKHGLLIPVEYISFLNNQDCIDPSGLSDATSVLYRTRSVPTLSRSLSVKDFEPVEVPGLRITDTVVWLGGIRPMTGVVRFVGRDGRSAAIPIKAWVEMDEHIDYGYDEFDLGCKFGCAKGRGRLLPVDELILLENYLPVENVVTPNGANSPTEINNPVSMDLIDFGQNDQMKNGIGGKLNGVSPITQDHRAVEKMEVDPSAHTNPRERIIPIILETSIDEAPKFSSPLLRVPSTTVDTESQIVPVANPPPPFIVPVIKISDFFNAEGLQGIQGRRNSCYIDVVLFAMFAFSDNFDSHFLEMEDPNSTVEQSELQRVCRKVLRENIVNPLRQNFFCPAESVTILRDLLKPLSDKVDGAFMDVEEFMLILFNKVFKLDEFIVYDNGVKDYLHQINLGDHILPNVITVKRCLELSMADYNLKLDRMPNPGLILELPRNSESVIQSTTIVPNLSLDVTDLVKVGYQGPKVLNLLAIICIKDYHYVTFVKCGTGVLSHWVLFDSNPSEGKPKVEIVPQMGEHLESLESYCKTDPEYIAAHKQKLPPFVQRLLADMYVCIYCPV